MQILRPFPFILQMGCYNAALPSSSSIHTIASIITCFPPFCAVIKLDNIWNSSFLEFPSGISDNFNKAVHFFLTISAILLNAGSVELQPGPMHLFLFQEKKSLVQWLPLSSRAQRLLIRYPFHTGANSIVSWAYSQTNVHARLMP